MSWNGTPPCYRDTNVVLDADTFEVAVQFRDYESNKNEELAMTPREARTLRDQLTETLQRIGKELGL